MKLTRRTTVALLVLLILGIGWAFWTWNSEPRYEGKTLTTWLKDYQDGKIKALQTLTGPVFTAATTTNITSATSTNFTPTPVVIPLTAPMVFSAINIESPFDAKFKKAIESMGPQAIPVLLKKFRPPEKTAYFHVCAFLNRIKVLSYRPTPPADLAVEAGMALRYVRNAKDSAIPALLKKFGADTNAWTYRLHDALKATFNQEPIGPMKDYLNHPDAGVRLGAVKVIHWNANFNVPPPLVSQLMLSMKDQNAKVRMLAAESIGRIRKQPELSIAALLPGLEDRDARVRAKAAWALGEFKTASSDIMNALTKATRDSDSEVKRIAQESLDELSYYRKPGVN